MRDDLKHVDSAIPFNPEDPNSGPILNWETTLENVEIAKRIGGEIAMFVNAVIPGLLDGFTVAADLVCLHCNGRPQDFKAWERASIVERADQYSAIYYNFDRRTGKLPDFVRLRFDAH